jgi:hypothetical protein
MTALMQLYLTLQRLKLDSDPCPELVLDMVFLVFTKATQVSCEVKLLTPHPIFQ